MTARRVSPKGTQSGKKGDAAVWDGVKGKGEGGSAAGDFGRSVTSSCGAQITALLHPPATAGIPAPGTELPKGRAQGWQDPRLARGVACSVVLIL